MPMPRAISQVRSPATTTSRGWRATRNGLPYMLPSVAQLEKLIGELGIDEDSKVVIVPAGVSATDFGAATRIYWTLKVAGVNEVSVLGGGLAAWTAAKYPLATGTVTPSPRIFTATINKAMIAELAEVEKLATSGEGTLIDARPLNTSRASSRSMPSAPTATSRDRSASTARNSMIRRQTCAIATSLQPLHRALPLPVLSLPTATPAIGRPPTGSSCRNYVTQEREALLWIDGRWSRRAATSVSSSRIKWDDIKNSSASGHDSSHYRYSGALTPTSDRMFVLAAIAIVALIAGLVLIDGQPLSAGVAAGRLLSRCGVS